MTKNLTQLLLVKASLLIITCFFFNLNSYSQNNKGYSLLWEIKGNGLSKPSYIFGSINFRDHRAFNFSDSVYIAIGNSSAFALEIHPDTLAKYLAKPSKNVIYSTDQNKPKTELKGANLTFPSHFLYGTARTLNKNFYGLADNDFDEIDTESEDDDNDEFNEDLDALLSIYAKGNLTDIHNELQQYYEENYFEERNAQLTAAIINIIKKETLFASVAAVLLPGDNGILAKLKKAGYELRPVEGNFTDLSKTNFIDFEKMNWQPYIDKIFNFSAKFPSTPFLSKNGQAKMIVYQDPVNYVGYTASALYTGPLLDRTSEQYVDTVLATYSKNDKVKVTNIKKYQKHGSTVVEATITGPNSYSKSKLIHVNGTYYSFTVESENDIINEPFINKFFNSVEINEPTVISQNDWTEFKSSAGGFTVKLPTAPQEQKQRIENPNSPEHPYFFTIYQAADRTSLMNYLIRYSDFPKGMYLSDKNLIFNTLIKDFETKGEIAVKPQTIVENGVEGITLDLIVSGSYMQIKAFIKGNRTYMVISQNMKGPVKPKEDIFFKTFSIKQELNTTVIPFEIGNFIVSLPGDASLFPNSKDEVEEEKKGESFLYDEQSYFTLNNNTGGVYGIEKSTISKYYRHSNPDTLLHTIANKIGDKGKIKELDVNNFKALEYVTNDTLAKTFKRSRIWFDGNNCYLQTLIADKDEIESAVAETFFNSSRLNSKLSLFDFKASKAKLIVDDLASQHEPTHQLALGAISFYKFEKDELPYIYTAVNQKYTDDTTASGTRYKLLEELEDLNDKETIIVLKKLYQDSKGLDVVQSKILSIAPYIDSTSYDWYFKNLSDNPPFKFENYWELFNPLVDSLSFAAANFDKILKLGEEKAYRPIVLNLIYSMLDDDNNGIYISKIEANKNFIEKHALKDLDEDIELIKKTKYSKTINYYISILPKINLLPLTDEITKKIIQLDSVHYIKTNAIAARIRKGLAVEESLISAQLDSLQSRYVIMRAFHEAGKIDLVPIKYREHTEFAKLLLADFLAEEYDYPESLNLLGSVKEDSKTYYAFDFTYVEDGEKKTYLGISGPFDEDKNRLKFGTYRAYSNFEIKDKDWLKQAKSLIEIFNGEN